MCYNNLCRNHLKVQHYSENELIFKAKELNSELDGYEIFLKDISIANFTELFSYYKHCKQDTRMHS